MPISYAAASYFSAGQLPLLIFSSPVFHSRRRFDTLSAIEFLRLHFASDFLHIFCQTAARPKAAAAHFRFHSFHCVSSYFLFRHFLLFYIFFAFAAFRTYFHAEPG